MLTIDAQTDERPADVGDLVRAAADGDTTAWRDLMSRYTPLLSNVARSYRLNHADASDVVQLAWLRLWENLPRLREPRAVVAWLCTTVRHESLRASREAERFVPVAELHRGTDRAGGLGVDEEIERRDRAARLRKAVVKLSHSDRQLLGLLLSPSEPSYKEVALRLGRPVGSIGPTRARCLQRLRRELTDAGLDSLN